MIHKVFVETEDGPVARVTFTLHNSLWADKVYLVGDFNGWDCSSHRFRRDHEGRWTLTIDLELGRAFQFRYLRDGQDWMNDEQADAYVHNRYGSDNFVVVTDPNFERYSDDEH